MMRKLTSLKDRFTAVAVVAFVALGVYNAMAGSTAINPVTGETENYTYYFTGATSGDWETADNWSDTTKTPGLKETSGPYDSFVFDGNDISIDANRTITASQIVDGWNLCMGLYHGVNVTINQLQKLQGDKDMWISVDASSKLTISTFNSGPLGESGYVANYYVASSEGITYSSGFNTSNNQGLTVNYWLTGNGSVKYSGAVGSPSHVIRMSDIVLVGGDKTVRQKTLVSFESSTVNFTADAVVQVKTSSGETVVTKAITEMKSESTLTTSDIVGSCELVQTSTGIVLFYVDGDFDVVTVTEDTSVSALNSTYQGDILFLMVSNGASINIDAAFTASKVMISTDETVHLTANQQPESATLAAIDFSNVRGSVVRSWLTPGVIGVNFRSNAGSDTSSACLPGGTWIQLDNVASGSNSTLFNDGLSVFNWSSPNTWSYGANGSFLGGYLDEDFDKNVTVTLSCVPYEIYDVIIYCGTDTENATFRAKTVNGKTYTWNSSSQTTVEGTSNWGASRQSQAAYGTNALRVNGLTGPLAINGLNRSGSSRGCISAIQIFPSATNPYTLTLDGTAASWSSAAWRVAENSSPAPLIVGEAEITFAASTALTVDTDVVIEKMTVTGSQNDSLTFASGEAGSFMSVDVVVSGGILKQGSASALGATKKVTVENGATFDNNGFSTDETTSFVIKAGGIYKGSGDARNLIMSNDSTIALTDDLSVSNFMVDGTLSIVKDTSAESESVRLSLPDSFESVAGTLLSVGPGVILDVGISRPSATLDLDEGATLRVKKASLTDIPSLKVSEQPVNIVLVDENGNEIHTPKIVYDAETGVLSVFSNNVWSANNGSAFETSDNWSSGVAPGNDESASLIISGQTTITVTDTFILNALVIYGEGEVTLSGSGSINANLINLQNGAILKRNSDSRLSASGYSLNAGTILVLDSVNEASAISGDGAVATYGNVTFAANNTFTGGLTVKTGTASTTVGGGFSGVVGDNVNNVTVEDGACLDLANTQNRSHSLIIAGKGVLLEDGKYSGAVRNSGSTRLDKDSRQTKSITLRDDAMVDVSMGWGIVRSGYNPSRLILDGHTLTMRGSGDYQNSIIPLVNVNTENGISTTGTLIVEGAKLEVTHTASNLAGINIVIKESAQVDFDAKPTSIGSLTLKPSETIPSVTADHWNLPDSFVPSIISGNIDPSGLSVGQDLTLLTVPSGKSLENGAVALELATSRYTASASANVATATVKKLVNFMHYDFNADGCKADDTTYDFGTKSFALVAGKNGKAALLDSSSSTTWYDSNTSGKTPFHAGEMSVTTLVKPGESRGSAIWSMGSGFNDGIVLVATNETTFALKGWKNGGGAETIVEVTDVPRLVGSWHFVTVVANQRGTTLYVDKQKASTDAVLSSNISQVGQFGSIHGTSGKLPSPVDGFRLDDWAVYDTALTETEVNKLLKQFLLPPFVISIR